MFNTEFWKAALTRAIRTMAQTAAGMITAGAVLADIDWVMVASAAAVSGIYCVLMALAGLPEALPTKDHLIDESGEEDEDEEYEEEEV